MNQQLINKYDSEFCGSLPIHLINVIQPYGALLVVSKETNKVVQISENLTRLFGMDAGEIIGRQLKEELIGGLSMANARDNVPQVCTIGTNQYLCILHQHEAYSIIEINLDSKDEALDTSFINVYKELKQTMNNIDRAATLQDALDVAARELKAVSGFDKVMIYRFDENWNGHVLAEEQEPEMESYLGFTFPASDIPRQARELYLRNSYRYIPDRTHEPVKLTPVINPITNNFLDISECNVRGVSSVHLEYLKNMNVMASMSTRIIKDGQLWGLIACHHRTARLVNYKMCAIFELLSGIITTKISGIENSDRHSLDNRLSEIYTSLVEESYRTAKLPETLLHSKQNILELFNASGAVITHQRKTMKKGSVPNDQELEDILLWLNTRDNNKVFTTDKLEKDFDYASEYRHLASGLMAISVDAGRDEYILLFRPEVVQVINWGGDPSTRINFEEDMRTYHPRFSFKLWQEKVSGTSLPWSHQEVEIAENLRDFVHEFSKGTSFNKN